MAAPLIIGHASSLDHLTGPHPERPARIEAIEAAVDAAGGLGWERMEAPRARREQLLAVHPERHVERIEAMAREGGGELDPETPVSPGSWEAALRAAGGSALALEAVLRGEARSAFAIHRPPGHHAEPDLAMGFCLFSNAAIAVRSAIASGLAERVAVVDWDVHHGNGTEAVFEADPDVLFASIHQSPLWPGTGRPEDRGTGHGTGTTINLPVPPGSGDGEFLSLLEHVVAPAIERHRADAILISAGYDAHADDPLAACTVTDSGFERMARSMAGLGSRLGIPVAAVLEGGYDLRALAAGVVGTLRGLADPGPPLEVPPTALSERALERVASGN